MRTRTDTTGKEMAKLFISMSKVTQPMVMGLRGDATCLFRVRDGCCRGFQYGLVTCHPLYPGLRDPLKERGASPNLAIRRAD